jgi:hypothetical protein
MANTNKPQGLTPVQYLNGSPWNGQARQYYIPSGNTQAFAIGDPVASSASADANGVPAIQLATAGASNAIRGVVVSAGGITRGAGNFDPTNLNTTVIPGTKTKDYYVLVADDPNILFEGQEGGTGTAFSAASVNANINLKSGTNNSFVSGWLLDNSATSTGTTYQLRLWGLVQKSNNAYGTYAKWLVSINTHELKAGTVGV